MDLAQVQPFVQLGLGAVPYATQNYHKITHPVKYKVQKMRGRGQTDTYDESLTDYRIPEERGLVLRKRSEVQSDEEIVEVVKHRGERLPRRPGMPRQASSMDNIRGASSRNGQDDRRVGAYRGGRDASDSEGSVPPRSRVARGGAQGRGRAKSVGGRSKSKRSSSSSSSDLGSSTEDEKKVNELKRKKWITAALAGVATIHAASNVYNSIEKHDKRIEQVKAGEISPEEAHKKQRQARWQDAASLAIAAIGIKGAVSEWQEVQEHQHEHKELLERKEEMHKKRCERERRKKAKEQNGYYKGRDGNWYYDPPQKQQGNGSSSNNRSRRSDSRHGMAGAAVSAVENY